MTAFSCWRKLGLREQQVLSTFILHSPTPTTTPHAVGMFASFRLQAQERKWDLPIGFKVSSSKSKKVLEMAQKKKYSSCVPFEDIKSIFFFFFNKTRSHYVAQAGLGPKNLLPQSPKYWDYRCIQSHPTLNSTLLMASTLQFTNLSHHTLQKPPNTPVKQVCPF
jgi:hypothetical protein